MSKLGSGTSLLGLGFTPGRSQVEAQRVPTQDPGLPA
jgi:hypothetical protein